MTKEEFLIKVNTDFEFSEDVLEQFVLSFEIERTEHAYYKGAVTVESILCIDGRLFSVFHNDDEYGCSYTYPPVEVVRKTRVVEEVYYEPVHKKEE